MNLKTQIETGKENISEEKTEESVINKVKQSLLKQRVNKREKKLISTSEVNSNKSNSKDPVSVI